MKRLLIYTAIAMATLTAVLLLWQFRAVLALFLLSMVVAAAMQSPVARMIQMGFPRPAAVLAVYLAGLILIIAAVLVMGRPLFNELQALTNTLAASYEMAYSKWTEGSTFQQTIVTQLPAPGILYEIVTGPDGGSLSQNVLGLTRGLLSFAAGVFIVMALSVYWINDQNRFERLWFSVLPVKYRVQARDSWRTTMKSVGLYLRSEAIQSVFALIVLFLGYWVIGLDFPITLAIVSAVVWLIPIIGFVLAIAPVFLVGINSGLALAIVAVIFTLAVLWFLEFVVEPRLFDRRRFSAILTIPIMLVLIEDFGVLGLVVAPPLAAAIQSFATYWMNPVHAKVHVKPADQLLELQERLKAAREVMGKNEATAPPEITSLADRLADLIDRAGHTV